MNYLQLCQRLRSEVGISGADATVTGATGEWLRVTNWIKQAWNEIQVLHDNWNFMRGTVSFATVAEQAEYPYASSPLSLTDFGRWRDDSFRIYKDSVGDEHYLHYLDYNEFRDRYLISTYQTTYAYPSVITVSPSDSLILALPPEAIYTVSGEYFKDITELSSDSDTPSMPSRYHMMIVYRAMMDYALYEAASEAAQRSAQRYQEMKFRLECDELPDVTFDRSCL